MDFFLVTIIIPIAAGVILLFIEYRFIEPLKKKQEIKRIKTEEAISNAQISLVRDLLSDIPETARERYIEYLIKSQRPDGSFARSPISIANVNLPEIDDKVSAALVPLKSRLEEIEKRFPNESTIDKIASVNDAILATKIEHITDELRRIEKESLSKWDVVVIVIEVLVAGATVLGLIFTAIQYFATLPTP